MKNKDAEELTKLYLPVISDLFDKSPCASDFTSYADGFLAGICFAGGITDVYEDKNEKEKV